VGSQFQNLPFHDAKLNSPGIFLSPYSPSSYGVIEGTLRENHSFEQAESDMKPDKVKSKDGDVAASAAKASEKGKERERNVTTPTNFAFDFGKGPQPSSPFDASNGRCCNASGSSHFYRSFVFAPSTCSSMSIAFLP
jgi:hypothetical protein